MSNVLIVFQSDAEPLEQMALAVAVGAVEAEGSIRLRRLAAPGAPEVGHQSYGKIKPADLEWADVVVVGLEHAELVQAELGPLLDLLAAQAYPGKRSWTFSLDGVARPLTQAQIQVEEALLGAGMSVADNSVLPDAAAGRPVRTEGSGATEQMKELGRLSGRSAG